MFIFYFKNLFKTAQEFLRLEKVEIGGSKGRDLTSKLFKMYEEFRFEFEKFTDKKYNPLDTSCDVKQIT